MTKQLYLVNKTATNLILKTGFLEIPPLSFAPITEDDKVEASVVWALGRDWAAVTDVKPKANAGTSEVDITIIKPYKGMTEAEMKASKLETVETVAAIGTALGSDEPTKEEAVLTQIGQLEEEVVPKSKKAK